MPAAIPVTNPVVDPMVAIPVLPLVHVPPGEASVSVIEDPMQTAEGPEIPLATGVAVTVTIAIAAEAPHPLVMV